MTTEQELQALAGAVNRARARIAGPARVAFNKEGGEATVMALSLLMCHTALHDNANEEDVLEVVRVAWKKSVEAHEKGCVGSG